MGTSSNLEGLAQAKSLSRSLGLRYSLRLLLLAVTLLAVGLGLWRAYIHPYIVQQEAIEIFLEAGGTVRTRASGSGPYWLRAALNDKLFQTVTHVDLEGAQINDECLDWLTRLPDLETFKLGQKAPGTLAAAEVDARLWNVDYLNLDGAEITDKGLAHLARLNHLETLFLNRTKITDEGLVHLEGMTRLRAVWLGGTEVTLDGVRRLRQKLPETYVGW